jgi:hypothetical protein
MKPFIPSILVTLLALCVAFFWGGGQGLFICTLLVVMEVSFSFDNAVVNATVLKEMNKKWQQRFLTWGMLMSVAGMYYLFPIIVVAFASGLSLPDAMQMATEHPKLYSQNLLSAHTQISSFGGMFLLMVVLSFLCDESKELHWLGRIEQKLTRLGQIEAVEAVIALCALLVLQSFLPEASRLKAMLAGVIGIVLYIVVHGVAALMGAGKKNKKAGTYSGWMGFLYINLLDASFSLDAVIGSFAISHDIVIILLGLSAGAMFVRSMTVHLVRKGTLMRYIYLEHGAYYGIGALAMLMLASMITPVSEVIIGLVGITFILLSLYSSISYNKRR